MIGDRIETNIAGGLDIPLPRMFDVRQKFAVSSIADITDAVTKQLQRPEVRAKVKPGMTIAVGCGSRGVANIAEAARAVVQELKAQGAKPFIFPAMGSHGAATAEGQRAVLEGYGITEEYCGVPIRATMETENLGSLPNGTAVHIDRYAAEADGIVLINRVKPHTNFRAAIESGVVKMITIGMGKIIGATSLHTNGMDQFGEILPAVARHIIARKPFLFGVGMVENALDETAIIEAMPAEVLFEREADLQAKAKLSMARLMFDQIDVLVIDEIGKNISGAGADPNVTGRNNRGTVWEAKPAVQKIVMLGLTKETKGNATGMGCADVITMRMYKGVDIGMTYANVITSAYLDGAAVPIIMNNDHDAVALGVKAAIRVKPATARIVRISNTLHLSTIQVSEAMIDEVRANPAKFEVLGDAKPWAFGPDGRIVPIPH